MMSEIKGGHKEAQEKEEQKHEHKPEHSTPFFSEMLSDIKKNKSLFLVLLFIVLFGLYLRAYHTDYPVIGYHNWKETHYLTEARNFARDGFFKYGFFVPAYDYPQLTQDPSGAHADTFPFVSIIVAIFFKIFGAEIAVARIVNILFSILLVPALFLFVRRLFNREDIAIASAALTAINPLFVFFSHNTQMQNPGVLFMVLAGYFYLRWRENDMNKDLILTSVFISLSALNVFTFLVILIPILLTFPFERIKTFTLSRLKAYIVSALILASIPLWVLYNKLVVAKETGLTTFGVFLINMAPIYAKEWWLAMRNYFSDNYTLLGFGLSIAGVIMLLYFFNKKKTFGERFMLAYGLGTVLFFILVAEKLGGHSYHQFPIAPFFIISLAYFLVVLGSNFGHIAVSSASQKEEEKSNIFMGVKYAIIVFLLLLLLRGSVQASNKQFDTQFLGLDIAGDYIKANSAPNERIIFSGGQSFGVLWHADRKGYYPHSSIENIQKAEQNNATWIFAYRWGLNDLQDAVKLKYVADAYALKQVGIERAGNQDQLVYLLFKKGGKFAGDTPDKVSPELSNLLSNRTISSRNYELTSGQVRFFYVDIE